MSQPGRRVVLILVPAMPSEVFLAELARPDWDALRAGGGLAVANASVPGPDTAPAAYLSLGAGQRLACPAGLAVAARPEGEGASDAGIIPRIRAANRGKRMAAPGGVASALEQVGGLVVYRGVSDAAGVYSGPGFLAAMDGTASVPALKATRGADRTLMVQDLPRGFPASETLAGAEQLSRILDPERDLLIVASPDPGPPRGAQWMGLAPVFLWGTRWRGQIAASATTRTRGLLNLPDLAPTILEHLAVPIPVEMEGHPATPAGAGRVDEVLRFARAARARREAMAPGLVAWGAVVFAVVLAGGAVLLRRRSRGARPARLALGLVAAFVPSMLIAALWPAESAPDLLLQLAGLTVLLGALTTVWSRAGSPLMRVLWFAGALILIDLTTGGRMLAGNLMSDFANVGGRFYGIGNEYQGLLLALAALAPFWFEDRRGRGSMTAGGWTLAAILWPGVTFLVGAPSFGADFGGAISMAIGFGAAAALGSGRRVRVGQAVLTLAGALATGALLIGADLARPPGSRTHVGELAARALSGGGALVAEIAARKVMQNVQFALTLYFLVPVAAVSPLLYLCYHRLGRDAAVVLDRRPLLRSGLAAALIGGAAALLLNDSGVVAWALATGCAVVLMLDLLLEAAEQKRDRTDPTDLD